MNQEWVRQTFTGPRTGPGGELTPGTASRREALPADLRDWVDAGTLLAMVERETDTFDWDNPLVLQYLREHPDERPRIMLCLLAFAYATRLASSEELVRACRSEGILRRLCGGHPPFARELCNFRRKNRGVLEKILGGVFWEAAKTRFGAENVKSSAELRREFEAEAMARLDSARHLDAVDE